MSKKAGKKAKAKVPEIDPNSPEWIEEVARKQTEAYDMIQRAMTRSQIDVVLATRDDLLKQREELETKAKQQSEDQSDIYQYLRNKLKDNYVAIAELETKVSKAHDERLLREKQLLAKIRDLNEEREAEKIRLEERVARLDVELTAIKEYQENSEFYKQTLKDMEAKIESCKDAFSSEVALMNQQLEEEWETGRRDKEERRKITKKAAAKATQEQLGPKTKIRIAQNKKMMSELRFQCCEVEKMHRARQGLMKSNTHLLAQAASSRHRVEELARHSHLLQRIIRYMHQKLQARHGSRGGLSTEEDNNSTGRADTSGGHEQRNRSAAAGARPRGVGTGGGGGGDEERGGDTGALYKLAGMSEEERQQMLDLREELRREEVGIAAAQALAAEMREELLRAHAERSRAMALKTDLARVLASCHEDPLLGADVGNALTTDYSLTTRHHTRPEHHHTSDPLPVSVSQASLRAHPPSGSELLQPATKLNLSDGVTATVVAASDGGWGGDGDGNGTTAVGGKESPCQGAESNRSSGSTATAILPAIDGGRPPLPSPEEERREEEKEEEIRQHPQQPQQQQQSQESATSSMARRQGGVEADRGKNGDRTAGDSQNAAVDSVERAGETAGGPLALWPENSILPLPAAAPAAEVVGGTVDGVDRGEGRGGHGAPRGLDADTLKAVARLFLAKLQVSVEAITPRPPVSTKEATSFPALMSGVSSDGAGGSSAFGIGSGTSKRHPRSSRRGTRQRGRSGGKGANKRKGITRSGGGGAAADHADYGNKSEQRDHPSRGGAGASGGSGEGRQIDGHRTGEGSRGARQSRGQSRNMRGWPDDATSWSDWHTTGIPSWDILEPSVRQTKRRRTRDAACQTLTYRELRDNANSIPCAQNSPTGLKNGGKNPNRPHGGAQQPHPRQQQQHHHVAPATRFVSMFNPPGSPLSSATTASTASVYRVTDRGGVVHGAIVRGSGGGGGGGTRRKERQTQRHARILDGDGGSCGGPETTGSGPDATVFPFRAVHARGEASAASTTTARPRNRDLPLDGHGMLPRSPPSKQDGGQEQHSRGHGNQDSAASPGGYQRRRPETSDNERLSPPVAQVSVSWGRGPEREEEGAFEEGEVSPSTAEVPPEMEVPSYTQVGRGPEAFQGDRDAGYRDVVGGMERPESGGGLVYEPLSKGPDYRKVLLFTVNDTDCRIWRRPAATDASKRSAAAGVATPPAYRDASGSIPRIASGQRGTASRSSSSRQRGRSVPAGANFVKSFSPSKDSAARTKGRIPTALGCRPHEVGLFVGNGSKVPGGIVGEKSRGDAGVENNSIVWDRGSGGEGGIDGGPTLCSSVSTLSGEAF